MCSVPLAPKFWFRPQGFAVATPLGCLFSSDRVYCPSVDKHRGPRAPVAAEDSLPSCSCGLCKLCSHPAPHPTTSSSLWSFISSSPEKFKVFSAPSDGQAMGTAVTSFSVYRRICRGTRSWLSQHGVPTTLKLRTSTSLSVIQFPLWSFPLSYTDEEWLSLLRRAGRTFCTVPSPAENPISLLERLPKALKTRECFLMPNKP